MKVNLKLNASVLAPAACTLRFALADASAPIQGIAAGSQPDHYIMTGEPGTCGSSRLRVRRGASA